MDINKHRPVLYLDFADKMAELSDAQLLEIINEQSFNYKPEAVEAARIELGKRNLSKEQIESIYLQKEIERRIEYEKENVEVDLIWKVLAFIFPHIFDILVIIFHSMGHVGIAKQLRKWSKYGLMFYIGLVIILLIIRFA